MRLFRFSANRSLVALEILHKSENQIGFAPDAPFCTPLYHTAMKLRYLILAILIAVALFGKQFSGIKFSLDVSIQWTRKESR